MTEKVFKIGTRGSELALWQANEVSRLLKNIGISTSINIIHSTGDKNRKSKLSEMGLVGVFTKELDDALLIGEIDIAVHSLKDVPTRPPHGIVQGAVLNRANPFDVLITKEKFDEQTWKLENKTIATGSLRRRALWQRKFPHHNFTNLRGNIPTRIEKLQDPEIDGIIVAQAAIDRLGLQIENTTQLQWMTPAPAQGVVGIFTLDSNIDAKNAIAQINNDATSDCSFIEREILNKLEGGCTAPIGAFVKKSGDSFAVEATVTSINGQEEARFEGDFKNDNVETIIQSVTKSILANGGIQIMADLQKKETEKFKVLCLKQLSSQNYLLGEKLNLQLTECQVIRTSPSADENEIKRALKKNPTLVLTSLNGLNAIKPFISDAQLSELDILCVGARVQKALSEKVKSIKRFNSSADLVQSEDFNQTNNCAWFHGNYSDLSFESNFSNQVEFFEVYQTSLLKPHIPNIKDYDAVLFFSPTGVESFLDKNEMPQQSLIGAIGTSTGKALHGKAKVIPTSFEFDSLLTLVSQELQQKS